ncbi:hypothetical protein Tsubulata_017533, partial [Turnera subulata]
VGILESYLKFLGLGFLLSSVQGWLFTGLFIITSFSLFALIFRGRSWGGTKHRYCAYLSLISFPFLQIIYMQNHSLVSCKCPQQDIAKLIFGDLVQF